MTALPELTSAQRQAFSEKGYLMLKGFYDLELDIIPIQRSIYEIIGICSSKYAPHLQRQCFSPDDFDDGYCELIAQNRSIGGEIYDAVKQIPGFQRLCCSRANEALFEQLRGTDLAGIAAGGSGIRIDNPDETRFQAPWHQEYPAQLRSIDGLVLWSPLRKLSPELGPVKICVGSHRQGLAKVYMEDEAETGRSGAYALRIQDEQNLVDRYEQVAPLSEPGDLIVMDWLTIHRSGSNVSEQSRWTMQLRYFNYRDAEGIRLGWPGSFAAGRDFEDYLPGSVVRKEGKE